MKFIFKIIVIFLWMLCFSCKAQHSLYGTKNELSIFFQSDGVLVFYSIDENLKKEIVIKNEDNSVYCKINFAKNILPGKIYFEPYEFYPDNYILIFEISKVLNNGLEIFIDKEKTIKKVINKEYLSLFTINTWEQYFIGSIIDFDINTNPIRSSNNEEAKELIVKDFDHIFLIEKIEKDWILIKCSDICGYECSSEIEGWIKWKDKNGLLIRILSNC